MSKSVETGNENVVLGYGQDAMRSAVLGQLFRDSFMTSPPEELLERLRKLWYARLGSLKKANFFPNKSDIDWTYLRNCPPFGVRSGTISKCCRLSRICPFCWAREVTSTLYDKLLAACYRPDGEPRPVRLFVFDRAYQFSLECQASDYLQLVRVERCCELKSLPTRCGAFVLHTISPFPTHVWFTRRTVVVAPANSTGVSPDLNTEGLKIWEPEDCSRVTLRKVTTHVSRYPWQLLRCPADSLKLLLEETSSVKLHSSFGCFRSRSNLLAEDV